MDIVLLRSDQQHPRARPRCAPMERLRINIADHTCVEFFVHVQRFCSLPGQPRHNEMALTIRAAMVGQDIVLRRILPGLRQHGTTRRDHCDRKQQKLCPADHCPLHHSSSSHVENGNTSVAATVSAETAGTWLRRKVWPNLDELLPSDFLRAEAIVNGRLTAAWPDTDLGNAIGNRDDQLLTQLAAYMGNGI